MIMDLLENPTPKKGETQKQFIKRCIPYVHDEHPSWKMDKVKAVCYDIYRRKHKNADEEMFHDEAQLISVPIETQISEEGGMQQTGVKRMIAVIGNRFMNGGFLSTEELKKCYKQWEGTLHDINHMGTSTGFFLAQTDIEYFIGWHSNVKINGDEVSMDLNIDDDTTHASGWKGYIGLCEKASKIPNVSVTYYGKRDFIIASKLPANVPWKKEGFGKDDLVPILHDIRPVCVSTVLQGRCNDRDGCGIRQGEEENEDNEDSEEFEKQKLEIINRIKEKEKKLK